MAPGTGESAPEPALAIQTAMRLLPETGGSARILPGDLIQIRGRYKPTE